MSRIALRPRTIASRSADAAPSAVPVWRAGQTVQINNGNNIRMSSGRYPQPMPRNNAAATTGRIRRATSASSTRPRRRKRRRDRSGSSTSASKTGRPAASAAARPRTRTPKPPISRPSKTIKKKSTPTPGSHRTGKRAPASPERRTTHAIAKRTAGIPEAADSTVLNRSASEHRRN